MTPMDPVTLDRSRLATLLEAGRGLVAQLEVDAVLEELLRVACELTGARYAAIGVLDSDRSELERFITRGIEPAVRERIGDLPRGHGVLGELKADPHLRDLPVLMTSALDELDSVVRCIEMGAEDYLTKPINPVLLQARINASLEKKRLRDQQRELISKFATSEVAEDLLTSGFSLGGKRADVSALFCDIRSFTTLAETLPPADVLEFLNRVQSSFAVIALSLTLRLGLRPSPGSPFQIPPPSAKPAAPFAVRLLAVTTVRSSAVLPKFPMAPPPAIKFGTYGPGYASKPDFARVEHEFPLAPTDLAALGPALDGQVEPGRC